MFSTSHQFLLILHHYYTPTMNSWEEMKEISYVGLKITKAKSLNQGLTRCKIDKLTRKNPVYEHLQLHKASQKMKNCPLCHPTPSEKTDPKLQVFKISKTEEVKPSNETKSKLRIKSESSDYSKMFNKILAGTPRGVAYQQTKRFNYAIQSFDKGLRKTRSHFDRICVNQGHLDDYFLTAVDDIELEMNQDKGLSLRQIKTDAKAMKEDLQQMQIKRKKMQAKIKMLNKPVRFPLNGGQIQCIIRQDARKKSGQNSKLSRMVSSLYEYKSCSNYSNRMKTIASIIQK